MGGRVSWLGRGEDALPQQRLPSMRLHLGASVPAWLLRVLAWGLAVGASLLVVDSAVMTALLVLASVLVLCWPGSEAPVVVAALIGWGLLATAPGAAVASGVVLGVHGFLVLTRLIGGLGWQARVQVQALRRVGGPFLVLQGAAQALLHLALVLPGGGPWVVWVASIALAVLVVLTALLVRALRTMR